MKKQLVHTFFKNGSMKVQWISKKEIIELELNYLKKMLIEKALPPVTDRRTKQYKEWKESIESIQFMIGKLNKMR